MPVPWSMTRIWTCSPARRGGDAATRLTCRGVLGGVGHHVPQGAAQVRRVGPGREARLAGIHLERDALLAVEAVERGGGLRQQGAHLDPLGAGLEGRRLGRGQLPHLDDHAAQGRCGGAGGLEVGRVLGNDPVDHGLELGLEHRGRGGQVVRHVAGGAPAEHLGRSTRAAMVLNAPASSRLSRSPPPVARALRSPASSRAAAAVRRPAASSGAAQ